MASVFGILSDEERAALRTSDPPEWTAPMLATLTRDAFSDPEWLSERKLDGVRCLAFRRGRRPRSGVGVYVYLFDLLHLDGCDLTRLPLGACKRLLKRALAFGGHVRLTPHRVGRGEAFLEEACAKGWEGIIAKRADSVYEHTRSRAWRKLKCGNRQELVIGGYTDPQGSRRGFGALLLGYYENGALHYAGKVGTGFDDALLEALGERLRGMQREDCPFAGRPRERGAHFVSPRLVGEVGFTEWTQDGKLLHPRFLGLRPDKSARQVRRERARRAPA